MKKWFKQNNVLFCTNGDIIPDSPLLDSISLYRSAIDDNLLCIPGKNIGNNMPIFGLQAFLMMINEAIKRKYDYIIYIDADCFIWSLNNLKSKFEQFIEGDFIVGGVPDGGVLCHRNTNNYCINPFLMFLNIKRVLKHIVNQQLELAAVHNENDIPDNDRALNSTILK